MTRVLFIGLDGATFSVLDHVTSDQPGVGVIMPFLRRLMSEGARAILRSTPNPLTPPAWVSIMTGRTPGHHGIFDFIRVEESGSKVFFTLNDSRNVRTETIWSIASRQERSIVALNFPLTAPPRRIRGSMVPGFVPWKHLRRNSTPSDLYTRLSNLPGFDPKSLAWDFDREKQAVEMLDEVDAESWVSYHLPREHQWYRIAQYLLSTDQPDFMAVLFDGVDKIQHQAWAFLDPNLISSDPNPWQLRMRELCLDYFRALDRYIEGLVNEAGPDAHVFMASDHGFTATTEVLRINSFLHQKGYLSWANREQSDGERRREASNFANVDWDKTLAYCRTPSSNGITIRVAPSPGEPGIAPSEYVSFRERLIADLESLRDERTGERIIKDILKREDWFPGSAMDDAPDLTLVLRDHGFVSIRNLEPVVMERPFPAGTHHPDGIFLAFGPGIRPGANLQSRAIVDVAPALLYGLDLPIPEDFEGEVPEELFTADYLRAHPIKKGPATRPVQDGETKAEEMGEDEKAKIIEQLKMLGYMEE
jgi:predicted AlkP superfamily phosphohydrolase/phosphomutase